MFKPFTVLFSLLVLSLTAQADFNVQLDTNYHEIEQRYQRDADSKTETYDVQGTYYFSPVIITQSPIREAAFLSQHSNISLQYIDVEQDKPTVVEHDRKDFVAGADIRIAESAFRLGGFIGSVDETFTTYDYSAITLGATFGWHIRNNSLLAFKIHTENGDTDKPLGKFDYTKNMFNVDYKHLLSLRDSSLSFGGGLGFAHVREDLELDDDYTSNELFFNAFVTWYVTPKFGFGGELTGDAIYSYTYNHNTESGRIHDSEVSATAAFTASYDMNEYIGFNAALGWGDGLRKKNSQRHDRSYDIHILTAGIQARF